MPEGTQNLLRSRHVISSKIAASLRYRIGILQTTMDTAVIGCNRLSKNERKKGEDIPFCITKLKTHLI